MAHALSAAEPSLLTADEFLYLPDNELRRELVRGEIREMTPAGHRHGRIGGRIHARLGAYVIAHDMGEVYTSDTGFILATDPDTVRAPDVSFVTRERALRVGDIEGFWPGAPDLAVEVISPTDRYADVDEKVEEYFAAGCRMVVVINPRRRIATVHHAPDDVVLVREDEVLDGGDVVPGWRLPLREIFGFGPDAG